MIVLSIIGLSVTILGLIVAVVRYTTVNEMRLKEIGRMAPIVRRIPHHEYRLQTIESKLDISVPEYINGNSHEDKD